MKIVMIGSGNVATVLGRKLKAAQHQVMQVYSRSLAGAQSLGALIEADFTDDWNEINADAELYIMALTDRAIGALPPSAALLGKPVVHTAGSVPMDVLTQLSNRY